MIRVASRRPDDSVIRTREAQGGPVLSTSERSVRSYKSTAENLRSTLERRAFKPSRAPEISTSERLLLSLPKTSDRPNCSRARSLEKIVESVDILNSNKDEDDNRTIVLLR